LHQIKLSKNFSDFFELFKKENLAKFNESSSAFFIKIKKINNKEINNQSFFNKPIKFIKSKIINNYKKNRKRKKISAYKDYRFEKIIQKLFTLSNF
jgi:hypothetical protein